MSIAKDSRTAKNLAAAFAGESQARKKYLCFAAVARSDGYERVASVFEAAANNEDAHAGLWLEALGGVGDVAANLAAAASGEREEWTGIYKRFAGEAAEEGYDDIASLFTQVAEIEKRHEERFRRLLAGIEKKEIQPDGGALARWDCRNCGHVSVDEKAPEICPTCRHKQSFVPIELLKI